MLTKLHISAIIDSGNMKKATTTLLILFLALSLSYADSESLNTEITTVSFGPHNFGFGLTPAGTDFMFYKYFSISDKLQHQAYFKAQLVFSFPNNSSFGGFDYETGTPDWSLKYSDVSESKNFISGYYFNPQAFTFLYFRQGFGINPVSSTEPLIYLGIGLNSRYSIALESLDVSRGTREPAFMTKTDDGTWEYKAPFGPGSTIQAYPWLQDNRQTLSNYLYFYFELPLYRSKGFKIYDGVEIYGSFEYGPSWLANSISMSTPTSDFYNLSLTATEYLALFSEKQENGWNWLSIELVHSNTFRRTAGEIVPYHKIPTDRLENSFTDSLYLKVYGPQFIAYDCYTDISVGLYNNCYFGNIVNENPKTTRAMEWTGSISCSLHTSLFGFMHLSYGFGYNFMRGIKASYPGFWQNAEVRFYISL